MSPMDVKSTSISPQFMLIIYILLYMSTNLSKASYAVDTFLKGEILCGNQTISSKNGRFEFGFFSPGSSHNYYIGIWYKALPNQTVVWVANREVPVKDPSASKLMLSETGNLILSTKNSSSSNNIQVWSTNSTTSSSVAAAVLLDTGNLVLLVNGSDLNSAHVWQSFEHPTDTILPGGWIGVNKITGEYLSLTSWKNSEDPSLGLFTYSMDLDGSNQVVLYRNMSNINRVTGVWNGVYFDNTPTVAQDMFRLSFIDDKDRKFAYYNVLNDFMITRAVMEVYGQIILYLWVEGSQQWQPLSAKPINVCDVYSVCGSFSMCEENSTSICQCLFAFQPMNDRDWKLNDCSKGCVRKNLLHCGDDANDWFFKMDNIRIPDNPDQYLSIGSRSDCEAFCRYNCSCSAYAYDNGKSNGCRVWKRELLNIRQVYDDEEGGAAIYLRLSAHDMPPSSHLGNNHTGIILGLLLPGVVLTTLVVIGLTCVYRKRRRSRLFKKVDGSLFQIHYHELQRMTKNFTEKLGSGGFGTVYKGQLPDSTPIAIKSLQGLRQGEKQFRAEVNTLGTIQHVNLVRLRGFCTEGCNRRLLVYDLMPKGSLDVHLFQRHRHHKNSLILNWSTRYQIALGIAKGLTYLHEECRDHIIHCDIKPDNILLDQSFIPKVADFGLAKLYNRDFSKVLTTMRGTIGYLAPEWLSGSEITPKVDVYSYGMMLFEIISGKRNTKNDHVDDDEYYYYPSWAASQIIRGDVMSILDEKLSGEASIEEVSRVGKVAIWCVQDMEEHRPTMGQIVQILEGNLEVNMPPISNVLQIHQEEAEQDIFHYSNSKPEI